MSFPEYKQYRLVTLHTTLDPSEYNVSSETWQVQAEQFAIRSWLKRGYLLQYNDPNSRGFIEDPTLIHWTYARSANIYPNFRPTPKNSLLGALLGLGPLFLWYYVFKKGRDTKEKLIQEGKLNQHLTSHTNFGNDEMMTICMLT